MAAPTRHEGSRKRNGHELHREAEESLPLYGFATNVGDRLSHVVRERPLLALAGGVAFGFVVGASVARRDGRLFVSAARLVLGWAAANLFEA